MNRRSFLKRTAAGLLIPAAPAIVTAANIMPVRANKVLTAEMLEKAMQDCWAHGETPNYVMFTQKVTLADFSAFTNRRAESSDKPIIMQPVQFYESHWPLFPVKQR